MAYIQVHQSLIRHRKTYLLAASLNVPRVTAVGHLVALWTWALDCAPTGMLAVLPPAAIADACEWTGDPDTLWQALVRAGYLDEDGALHDWAAYAGRLLDRRAANVARMRAARAQHVQRTDGAQTQHVQRTFANCAGAREEKSIYIPPTPNGGGDSVLVGDNEDKRNGSRPPKRSLLRQTSATAQRIVAAYPRADGRAKAAEYVDAYLSSGQFTAAALEASVANYLATNPEAQYMPHASTFFSPQSRKFEDYVAPAAVAPTGPRRMRIVGAPE